MFSDPVNTSALFNRHKRRMTILQAGFAKSGNMLVHVILRSMLELAGYPYRSVICSDSEWQSQKAQHLFNSDLQPTIDVLDVDENAGCRYIVSSFYKRRITSLKEYAENCSIIWTHSEYTPPVFDPLLEVCDLMIYVLRDARAVLNSMAHYIVTEYYRSNFEDAGTTHQYLSDIDQCIGLLKAWRRNVEGFLHLKSEKILVIRYEVLTAQKERVIGEIASRLNLSLSDEVRRKILDRSSPQEMRRTMPDHVRRCSDDDWKANFSPELVRRIRTEMGDLLEDLGYSW